MKLSDLKIWRAFIRTVTPLGQPEPPSIKPFSEKMIPIDRIDLHGLTLQEAFDKTRSFISGSAISPITIITGKSGMIRNEFETWLLNDPNVSRYEVLNGDGAFRIFLAKRN